MICKGTILEIQKDTVVVLTEDCRFIRIKRHPNMFIGQQITTRTMKNYRKFKNRRLVSAFTSIVAVALFIFFFLTPVTPSIDTYAYIDLDMNYSLSLNINRKGEIISIHANDEKTSYLIKDIDIKNKNINEVLISLLDKENQLSTPSKVLLISASLKEDYFANDKDIEKEQQHLISLMDSLQNTINTKETAPKTIKVIYSTAENKKIAAELSISMFKYYVYSKLKTSNPHITLEDIKEKSEKELLTLLETPTLPTKNNDSNQKNNEFDEEINDNSNSNSKDKTNNNSKNETNDNSKDKPHNKTDKNPDEVTPQPSPITESNKWQLNTNYSLGTEVTYEGVNYKCIQNHTSYEGWEPPVTPSLWERILSDEDEGQWFSNVFYPVNTIVIYNNKKYKCMQSHTSHTGWEPPNATALWEMQD